MAASAAVTAGLVVGAVALMGLLALGLRWPRLALLILGLAGLQGAWLASWDARAGPRPVELREVPGNDQGIDFAHPVGGRRVYPLVQMSTARPIVDRGAPVLMDADGHRLPSTLGS